MTKRDHITRAELSAFLPGDVIRLIPLEDPDDYKYYKMPGKPTNLVFMFADPAREVLGSPYLNISMWRRADPNDDADRGYTLAYVDRDDSQTLFFNGESTCETHDYVIELVKKVSDQDAVRTLQANWDVLFAAEERRMKEVDFDDVVETALWREGSRVLRDLKAYMRKQAKELATGEHYPLHMQ